MIFSRTLSLILGLVVVTSSASAQGRITTPLQEFGHNIGDDYFLANYQQLTKYWEKLDRESDRMRVVRIGTTAEGRPMLMAIITAPENFRKLGRYQEIAAKLAHADGLNDEQARALAREGKAVVWIDGGLHASEVLGAQQLIQYVYEMVSRNDAETQRFLRDDILLAVPANPDGMDLVSNWYMRDSVKENRSTAGVPRLYHKYIGHDNNRDSYMASQPETQAADSILYRAWYPHIVYNHHQTGPEGTVIFAPPFRDPFNYNLDPLIPVGIDLVGAAIHSRFIAEGKPGATMRNGANFSTWWNGGLRTTVYFHNMIGLLTETFGNPTPGEIALVPERLLPSGSTPFPILPQKWHFAQSMAYELSANRAVMDVASKYREDFLFNAYRMGRNSIDRGRRDTWTLTPQKVDAVKLAVEKDSAAKTRLPSADYVKLLKDPAARDPRGYIIPSNQKDFATAVKFVNALVKNGVTIHRATRAFSVAGRTYPEESYVVITSQAFRPHVLDMFEPQNHPDDIPYPGGPPTPPYDNAGWTLAYQMGVKFDRILDSFTGPFEKLNGFAPVPAGTVGMRVQAPESRFLAPQFYSWTRGTNDSFTAANRLLKAGQEVYTLAAPAAGTGLPAGAFVVRNTTAAEPMLRALAAERGVTFSPVDIAMPGGSMTRLHLPRIALWDVYGGEISSGWMRFVFDQFEFPYEVVFANDLDNGDLSSRYDVLVLPNCARLSAPVDSTGSCQRRLQPPADKVPAEWHSRLGRITIEKTLPRIRSFVENGGTLLALGVASEIAYRLELPVSDAVVDESDKPLPRAKYYVPGSVLSVAVDTTNTIAWGMSPRADIFFDNNPAFRLQSGASAKGVKRVAWFDSPAPLRSGWAWGQKVLDDATEILVSPMGKGSVVLYGPQVYFRGQTHGAFRFLFNGIYYGQLNRP
ncbi:MAG: M14 family metallopeptidase [Gemmatimonadaceae bacterium]|nr:M14 family metallopeptidase [Gemmatimonadaceae bacterium]